MDKIVKFNGIKIFSLDKTILMKVTSRERPKQLIECINVYLSLANNPYKMKWMITLDGNDHTVKEIDFGSELIPYKDNVFIYYGDSTDKINAINRDVNLIDGWDILLNISDDQLPIVKGYDDIIRSAMPDDLDYSLWFNDGHQMRINTQEILGYNYYKRHNYIYNPNYKSFFCDNEASEVAKILRRQRVFNECIIKHFHPGWDKTQAHRNDALYEKNNKYWKHDEDLYNARKLINFGL